MSNLETLIGEDSFFFVQPSHATGEMIPVHDTESFWNHVHKRWKKLSADARANNDPIVMFLLV